jgi:hypothetical protein
MSIDSMPGAPAATEATRAAGAPSMTVKEVLETWFPGRDVMADLERAAVRLGQWLDELASRLSPTLKSVCEVVETLERMPPAPGYEPLLIARAQHPLVARIISYTLIKFSALEASKGRMERQAVDAIRFLAKPGRRKRAVSRRVDWLISDWDRESGLAGLRAGNIISFLDFTLALESFARGDPGACEHLTQTAAAMAPLLSVRRGRRASRATIAHQMLLSAFRDMVGSASYTWDLAQEDFTDPLTRATRLAFGDPDFDPRPAVRRKAASEA